ncbi:MAG TPA: hypothetical protein VIY73_17375 [Polyangiaceae bacterium]
MYDWALEPGAPVQHRDYIQRLMEQVAAAVSRVADHVATGKLDEADEVLDATWTAAVGLRRADVGRLDAGTMRVLLGLKKVVAAQLLVAEATVEDARGRHARAESLRRTAAEL